MTRPLWVLDTKVVVSAAISPGGNCAELIRRAVAGAFTPAWDNTVLREYRDVLRRSKFKLSAGAVDGLLASFPQRGFHPGLKRPFDLPDPDDEPFQAVALATDNRVLVSGNRRHFPSRILKELDITLLSPQNALAALALPS